MPHVDDGTLHALLDGALRAEDPEGAAAVEQHLARCEDCRARLDAAAELRDGARSILDAAAPATVAAVPDFGEVKARAGSRRADADPTAGGTRRHAPRRRAATQARWTRRAAWAASLVVALGTGYLLRDLAGPPAPTAETRLMGPDAARDGAPTGEPSASAVDSVMADRGGSADGRTGGAADGQTGGSADGRTGGSADGRAGGPMSGQGSEQADGRPAGAADAAGEAPTAPAPDTRPPQRPLAADEETVVVAGRAEALEERRATDERETVQRARQLSVTAADAPSAIPTAPWAAQGGTPAMAAAETRVVEEAHRWSAVALDEARRSLEGPVYVLPRASIMELYLSADTAAPRVMSRQRLESGVVVEVVQWRGEDEKPSGAMQAEAGKAAPPATEDRPGLPSPEVARVVRGPFLLQVTGSLPGELLEILAGSATPAP
jgi:hypothetical protein